MILRNFDLPWSVLLLTIFVLSLGILVLSMSLFLLLHHVFSDRARARQLAGVRAAAAYLAPSVVSGVDLEDRVRIAISRFGRSLVATVLRRARVQLRGPAEARVTLSLESSGEVKRLSRRARRVPSWRRIQALRELGECGGKRACEPLMAALDDEDFDVRREARQALLVHRSPLGVEAAVGSFVRDSKFQVAWRRSFFARLAAVASHRLAVLVADDVLQPTDLKLAMEALAEERAPEALALALLQLDSPDPELRSAAARLLGNLKRRDAVDRLLHLLGDGEWFVRASAARALSSLEAEEESCAGLRERLDDTEWWVRRNAAHTLSMFGSPGVRTLLSAIPGEDRYARDAALASLAFVELGPGERSELAELVRHVPDEETDRSALDQLTLQPSGGAA